MPDASFNEAKPSVIALAENAFSAKISPLNFTTKAELNSELERRAKLKKTDPKSYVDLLSWCKIN